MADAEFLLVLLVDSDSSTVEVLSEELPKSGMVVHIAETGAAALELFAQYEYDVVLLEVSLDDMSGLELCREIKRVSDIPVLIVSSQSDEFDVVLGFEMGANDYIFKPCRVRELESRILAHLSHYGTNAEQTVTNPHLTHGDLEMNLNGHEVKLDGQLIELTVKQFEILWHLVSHAGEVITRQQLVKAIWDEHMPANTKTLDVHIQKIRSKIENPNSQPKILTVRGVGFKFQLPT